MVRLDTRDKGKLDLGPLAAEYAAAIDLTELQDFAEELGLSVEGLVRLGIGWSAKDRAWSFPMRDAAMRVVGVRLRSWIGRKWAIRGGREGLFIPTGLNFQGPLLIAEGPTDVGALLDLDFAAVGRPSCTGGSKLLAALVRHTRTPGLVIVADSDGHGRRGAEVLVSALLPFCRSVRMICPPNGIKDAREWKRAGGMRPDVQAAIKAAPVRTLRTERRRKR